MPMSLKITLVETFEGVAGEANHGATSNVAQ